MSALRHEAPTEINQELWADRVLASAASPRDTRPATGGHAVMVADGGTSASAPQQPPFLGESQRQAAQAIQRALTERHVFVALTGAPGLGKTTLLASAIVAPPGRQLRTIRVVDPDWITVESAKQIEHVAFEPGERTNQGEPQTILVVDDAHTSSQELLRCLTRIAVRGWSDPRSPQVILAGRPELWDKLADAEFDSLLERITFRSVLQPLSDEDARSVIGHALEQPRRVSGQNLTGDAEQEVLRFAQGMPGRIEMVVSSALTLRDVEIRLPVSADMVRSAAAVLEGKSQLRKRQAFVGGWTLAAALLATGVVTTGIVLSAQGWPPGRALSVALGTASRVVPWQTPPRGDASPVVAEASRQASVTRSDAGPQDPPSPVTASPAPPPTEISRADQALSHEETHEETTDRTAAVARDLQPQAVPLTLASRGGDDRPAAVASDTAPSVASAPSSAEMAQPTAIPAPAPAPASIVAAAPATPEAPPSDPAMAARPGPQPVTPSAPPAPLSPKMIALLLQRGDEMLALADYAAARRFYERTVSAGSAMGARNIARSYDPALLGRANSAADPVAAATWYGVAATLGDAYSVARLDQLKKSGDTGPRASTSAR